MLLKLILLVSLASTQTGEQVQQSLLQVCMQTQQTQIVLAQW